jgi:hypothetical protein
MFVENVETRLLPKFDDIKKEAKKAEEEEYDRLRSCGSPDTDSDYLAEKAHDAV